MKQDVMQTERYLHSYTALEECLRSDLDQTNMSYREIATAVNWSHTQIWSFHKGRCKLQFDVLSRLALLFKRHYVITNVTGRGQRPDSNVIALSESVKEAITESMKHGISYRKIGRITNISHEWIRCFHTKNSRMDPRKIIAIADYLRVYYELNNEKELKRKNILSP